MMFMRMTILFFLDHQQNVLFLKQKESLSLCVSILYHVVCVDVDHCFSFSGYFILLNANGYMAILTWKCTYILQLAWRMLLLLLLLCHVYRVILQNE